MLFETEKTADFLEFKTNCPIFRGELLLVSGGVE